MHHARPQHRWILPIACALVGLVGCAEPERLALHITSQAPETGPAIDTVRLLFWSDGITYPGGIGDADHNIAVSESFGGHDAPLVVGIDTGTNTFPATGSRIALAHLSGLAAGAVVTHRIVEVNLDAQKEVDVHLTRVPLVCDGDGDGFMDCGMEGCCPGGLTTLTDCEPQAADSHPWWKGKDFCDGRDNDCDGETDESYPTLGDACDGDGDGVEEGTIVCDPEADQAVCSESLVPTDEVCDGVDNDLDGQTDEDLAGIPERCNLLDDDCDGQTDEDFPELGEICDGDDGDVCELGEFTCDLGDETLICLETSSFDEDCGNGVDDDCDDLVDGADDDCL